MFHKTKNIKFNDGTEFELTFRNGKVFRYDISVLFDKYPQLKALMDRKLFLQGKLVGNYGIIWNDDLDLEAETVYEEGELIREEEVEFSVVDGENIANLREKAGYSQQELANLTKIDQADISKIERGLANPTLMTIERIAVPLKVNPCQFFAAKEVKDVS